MQISKLTTSIPQLIFTPAADEGVLQQLIYEIAESPIYYRGYREVLQGTKQLEEVMGSSYLQSLISSLLIRHLLRHLPENYQILTNELGLQFSEKKWRSVDIAIYEFEQLKDIEVTEHYLNIPPKVVIEVDTQADLTAFTNPFSYYAQKTDALLEFGVEKVIWIFTDAQKVMIAEPAHDWIIRDWKHEFTILMNVTINLEQVIQQTSIKFRAVSAV